MMKNSICVVLLTLSLVALASLDYAPVVHTKLGPVQGRVVEVQKTKVDFYEGIRYGQVDQRFGLSKMVSPWTKVYNATYFRWACPQQGKIMSDPQPSDEDSDPLLGETSVMSEDCLFLNIWRPSGNSSKPRPVMVWIYGGAFAFGTIFSSLYNSGQLAASGDIVTVSINYRLGAFGFLYAGTEDSPGNQGLLDQILALQWVRDNIAMFGGDPNQVTIFGESAGSMSVGALILSPLAKGLFHRAIMESGSPNSILFADAKQSIHKARLLGQKVNCNQAKMEDMVHCLRHNTSVNALIEASKIDPSNLNLLAPNFGTSVLPENPVDMLKKGHLNQVDLLYGVTRDEGSMFITSIVPDINPGQVNLTMDKAKQMLDKIGHVIPLKHTDEIIKYYLSRLNQKSTEQEMREVIYDLFGDYTLVCPTLLFGEQTHNITQAKHKVYAYRLLQKMAFWKAICPDWMGICHASDIPFVFGLPDRVKDTPFATEADVNLSHVIMNAWVQFAKTGNPGSIGSVQWEEAVSKADSATRYMALQDGGYKMVTDNFRETCDRFWKPRIFNFI